MLKECGEQLNAYHKYSANKVLRKLRHNAYRLLKKKVILLAPFFRTTSNFVMIKSSKISALRLEILYHIMYE